MMEQMTVAAAIASTSGILMLTVLVEVVYAEKLGALVVGLALLCFFFVFVGVFCILRVLRVSAKISTTKKLLLIVETIACIVIIHGVFL